jgi:two-component system, chemotaxis family, CheB/CheR fusion protein
LLRDTASLAQRGQDEVAIRSRVDGPLPLVRADLERLRQVITNLIDNAVKYSPAGAAVDVEAFADNGRITVEVRDQGGRSRAPRSSLRRG